MRSAKKIQYEILRILIILVSVMTCLITAVSIFVNIKSDSENIDRNLQNVAQTLSKSVVTKASLSEDESTFSDSEICEYFNSMKSSLSEIDVISIIDINHIRRYHTNNSLIGTVYDGTIPDFSNENQDFYVASDTGPSGSQRRAYAAIYDENGNYMGFILAVMLNRNIHQIILKTIIIHLCCAAVIIIIAVIMSRYLTRKIKKLLRGYEPDTFSAMFSIRDNILESLDEGILAIDSDEKVIYMNKAAQNMLNIEDEHTKNRMLNEICPYMKMKKTLMYGEKYIGVSLEPSQGIDILADQIPVMEHENISGALCILRDRTEYTKMMEDLSGVRYLVESMRANNHDFINKLHVILGLIQMEKYDDASEYITHVTSIQQNLIHRIMKKVEDPSVAALLIGKYARASELNIQFTFKNGSKMSRNEISLPSGDMVTIIGNLLDNAMDSINQKEELPKELEIGIFTQPHALLISVDDTGLGMSPENQARIFENGFSTKGDNRGTGLFVVHNLIEKYGGSISVESELNEGTSFTVTLTDERI